MIGGPMDGPEDEETDTEGDGSLPDLEAIFTDLFGTLEDQCKTQKQNICIAKDCCPKCDKELDAMYGCVGKSLEVAIEEGIGGLGDMMQNLTDIMEGLADITEGLELPEGVGLPSTEAPASAPEFSCDLTAVQCDGGKVVSGASAKDMILATSFAGLMYFLY